jgi:diacylglycerol kinase family enzyme
LEGKGMSLIQKVNEILGIKNEVETTVALPTDEQISNFKLCLYLIKWVFLNLALIGFTVFFWKTVDFSSGGGVWKFVIFMHAAIILGFYKVNDKYFKYISQIIKLVSK